MVLKVIHVRYSGRKSDFFCRTMLISTPTCLSSGLLSFVYMTAGKIQAMKQLILASCQASDIKI